MEAKGKTAVGGGTPIFNRLTVQRTDGPSAPKRIPSRTRVARLIAKSCHRKPLNINPGRARSCPIVPNRGAVPATTGAPSFTWLTLPIPSVLFGTWKLGAALVLGTWNLELPSYSRQFVGVAIQNSNSKPETKVCRKVFEPKPN